MMWKALVVALVVPFVQGLRRVKIKLPATEVLDEIPTPSYVADTELLRQEKSSSFLVEPSPPSLSAYSTEFEITRRRSTTKRPEPDEVGVPSLALQEVQVNQELRIVRPQLRQVRVGPRGGKKLSQTFQKLRPMSQQRLEETSTVEYVRLPTIGEETPPPATLPQDALKKEVNNLGTRFFIPDISSFADSNCGLIQVYFPAASCKQISTIARHCRDRRKFT